MASFTKEFDSREACADWLRERGLSGVIEEMFPAGWLLTLEGGDAKRARNDGRQLALGGFSLAIEEDARP